LQQKLKIASIETAKTILGMLTYLYYFVFLRYTGLYYPILWFYRKIVDFAPRNTKLKTPFAIIIILTLAFTFVYLLIAVLILKVLLT